MPRPERKSPRHRQYDYAANGAYFITACTRARACLFGTVVSDEMKPNRLGRVIEECWASIPDHFPAVGLDTFVVMPNHVHGIVWMPGAGHAPYRSSSGRSSRPSHGVRADRCGSGASMTA
jgi:REP element-mobilizing transposase RayT